MASPEESLGDVIDLDSSSDESSGTSIKKRPLSESHDSGETDNSRHRSKRLRTQSNSEVKPAKSNDTAEEGEVDEESEKDQSLSAPSETQDTIAPSGEQREPQDSVFMPLDPPIYRHKTGTKEQQLKLPVFPPKLEGTWEARFTDWAKVFCTGNASGAVRISSPAVVAAYSHYVDQKSGLKPKKKKAAKQAASTCMRTGALKTLIKSNLPRFSKSTEQDAQSLPDTSKVAAPEEESEEEYEPKIDLPSAQTPGAVPSATEWASLMADPASSQRNAAASGSNAPNGQRSLSNGVGQSHDAVGPAEDTTVKQLRKYFPSATDPTNMCLLCGRNGHTSANCSASACRFCGASHWAFSCPTRSRCGKCRQLGHSASTCEEKLALTKDEGLACCFCGSADHLEDDCTEAFRSFVPDADSIHTVVFIAPSCSLCGSGHHYSADCAERRSATRNPTWSLGNRDRYMDKNCQDLAIEDAAARAGGAQKSRAPEMKIRGHASRTNNVHYSESDDSDNEFLGKRAAKKRAPLGQIRMASNIQMPSSASEGGSRNAYLGGPSLGQPPLPPGPPPPGPPPRQSPYGRLQSGNPSSLPAKPPPSSWNQRNGPPAFTGAQQPQGTEGQSWRGDDRNASSYTRSGDFGPSRGGQRGGRGGRGGRGCRGGRGRGRGGQ
ncbi:hypothetical protein ACRE_044550 [Hapsidospora chrysogenum ATCC 11550]|uniref:CCHC-type domain-containing protein n=1 Tax=Hapsidospora chrysogenum (strain ATCC 11550 / CBS 779.69 / DSM 880 / IAM 14645 / JCM 23072 / IMI 49137) TaxID=857340 RepID=A0A086T5Y0_HAPC1|nr:hypothetical protein ACRE_044550 [Hapsidospora chrysogenum ATCC 11550]